MASDSFTSNFVCTDPEAAKEIADYLIEMYGCEDDEE